MHNIKKQLICFCVGALLTRLLQQVPYIVSDGQIVRTLQQSRSLQHENEHNDERRREPKLGDGCYHIFLDIGSNIGIHARILLEPQLYPDKFQQQKGHRHQRWNKQQKDKVTARRFFASQFGPEETRDNSNICIFAFEPNPAHIPRHKEMERVYTAMGWRYHFIHGGVSNADGILTFYHIGKGDKELERGFTTIQSRCHHECRPEEVKVYRLSDWIEHEIRGRIIPDIYDKSGATSANRHSSQLPQPQQPRVVMKMDIEMGEWLVFPDLLTSGVLCRDIDAFIGEFHLKTHEYDYPIQFASHNNWTLHTYQEAEVLKNEMFGMVERNPNCKTELVVGDDESYGADGMPWPKQPTYVMFHIYCLVFSMGTCTICSLHYC